MFKIRFKVQLVGKHLLLSSLKEKKQNKTELDKLKMPRLQDMDGNHFKMDMNVTTKFCYIKCKPKTNL